MATSNTSHQSPLGSDLVAIFVSVAQQYARNPGSRTQIARAGFDRSHPHVVGRELTRRESRIREELGALEAPGRKPDSFAGSQNTYEEDLWKTWLQEIEAVSTARAA